MSALLTTTPGVRLLLLYWITDLSPTMDREGPLESRHQILVALVDPGPGSLVGGLG